MRGVKTHRFARSVQISSGAFRKQCGWREGLASLLAGIFASIVVDEYLIRVGIDLYQSGDTSTLDG
jgi:hypothetical protein